LCGGLRAPTLEAVQPMQSSTSIPPPGFVPRPARVPDELMTGAPVNRALLGESRRKLDTRRLGALILDDLLVSVVVVVLYLLYGLDFGTSVLAAGLAMTYHFLFDLTSGQTIGKRAAKLRVVMADGTPVTRRAASARAVLRTVDFTPAGLAVYLFSRGRRRRIGDYAAGTIVCDVERVGTFRRELRGGDTGYPAAWLVTGVTVVALTATGHTPWSYRVRADRVCASAGVFLAQHRKPSPIDELAVRMQMEALLRRMATPPNWRVRHAQLLNRTHAENVAMATLLAIRRDDDRRDAAAAFHLQLAADHAALRRLGYRACA
jgi:uncharacterized RDD family membrane protein YckC